MLDVVQVVPQGAITDISGDIVQGLPFSIFPKLGRLALGEALKPPSSALHGTQAQPVLCVLQDHDRYSCPTTFAQPLEPVPPSAPICTHCSPQMGLCRTVWQLF